jgi:hypothetical protein
MTFVRPPPARTAPVPLQGYLLAAGAASPIWWDGSGHTTPFHREWRPCYHHCDTISSVNWGEAAIQPRPSRIPSELPLGIELTVAGSGNAHPIRAYAQAGGFTREEARCTLGIPTQGDSAEGLWGECRARAA